MSTKVMSMMVLPPEGSAARELDGFRFFWAKYVNGLDPTEHCAKCLLGDYAGQVNRTMPVHGLVLFTRFRHYDYVYVCGVADRGYDQNFHAPLRFAEGRVTELVAYNGYRIVFGNAELLPIPALPPGWRGYGRLYTRCRNFQFAVDRYGKAYWPDEPLGGEHPASDPPLDLGL